ncbi:ATPase, T2SS/T4P/T4SS family [Ruminiclostridium papyrosolvens]|uniref:Secretion system protein E n=1 Tax=Ruminiclostridium papyrosolvens C7 TaxID=1330534 RepID=U4R1M6_9FIRM|nr:ATPase, T2SS/T4P/T4SS family [Ruminiclostridium papyrosolvens]EPR11950.1 secretion system protein E [Ruminiclostridium papyrosolvens C7]
MIKLDELIAVIEEKIKSSKKTFTSDKEKVSELQRITDREQELRIKATEGNEQARDTTRNMVFFILSEIDEITHKNIDEIIFQYHLNYFQNIYTGDKQDNIKKPIDTEIEAYLQKFSISTYDTFEKKLQKLAQIIYQELFGFSILDELIFESELNEVATTRSDYVWIQYKGIKRKVPNSKFRFYSNEVYTKIIEDRIVSTANLEMNKGNPIIYSTLENGSRVTALRSPLSRYYVVNIRIFAYKSLSKKDRNRFMHQKMMEVLKILSSKGRRNIAIIGEMGSGKTTAADELVIKNLDDDLAIGLAENIHELNISGKYQDKNVIELQYADKYTPTDIMEIFFRLNRDIVIFGEVRSHMEAFEMINAMLRQARGSMCTFHSSSIPRLVHDLRKLLMQTGFYTDYREARFDIADAIDLVIQIKLDRDTGVRYVYKFAEIIANEEDMSYIIRDLFIYDKVSGKYLVNRNGISESTLNSCMEFEMTQEDREYLKGLFVLKPDEDCFSYEKEEPHG